jgi:hypothetical protein
MVTPHMDIGVSLALGLSGSPSAKTLGRMVCGHVYHSNVKEIPPKHTLNSLRALHSASVNFFVSALWGSGPSSCTDTVGLGAWVAWGMVLGATATGSARVGGTNFPAVALAGVGAGAARVGSDISRSVTRVFREQEPEPEVVEGNRQVLSQCTSLAWRYMCSPYGGLG